MLCVALSLALMWCAVDSAPTVNADQPADIPLPVVGPGPTVVGVDSAGRYVTVRDPELTTTSVVFHRVDRRTGIATRLPDAYAASADGSAVITTDGRWLDTRTGRSSPARPHSLRTVYILSGDGRTYFWREDNDGPVSNLESALVDSQSGQSQPLPFGGWPLAISDNGRYVLFGVTCGRGHNTLSCDLWRWDRTTETTSYLAPAKDVLIFQIGNNGRVLFRDQNTGSVVADTPGRERQALPFGVPGTGYSMSMSGSGRFFVYTYQRASGEYEEFLVDIETGLRTVLLSAAELSADSSLGDVHPSGDGSVVVGIRVLSTETSATFWLWTKLAADLRPPPVANVHAGDVFSFAPGSFDDLFPPRAAMLNVTVTNPVAAGFVTLWPCDQPMPSTSNINFVTGQTVANAVLVQPAPDGTVCATGNVDVDLVVDRLGWFDPDPSYNGVPPARLIDTRDVSGGVEAGQAVEVDVAGRNGVGDDASTVMLNVTVTNPADAGFATAWPCGEPQPLASNVNFQAGQTVAVAVLSKVGSDGRVCVASNTRADFVVDVQGWFDAASPYRPLSPVRVEDTRVPIDGSARLSQGSIRALTLPGASGVGLGATAVMLSVTAVDPATEGFVTVASCDWLDGSTSSLNVVAGGVTANAVLAGVGPSGQVCVYASMDTDIVIDVQGWFGEASDYTSSPGRMIDTR
jgi:hypothetical protein